MTGTGDVRSYAMVHPADWTANRNRSECMSL